VSDIAEKLLTAIGQVEKAGRFGPAPVAYVVEMGRGNYLKPEDVSIAYASEETERTAVLRRCAADREIVALHRPSERHGLCDTCRLDVQPAPGSSCDTLRILARGYGVTP
jgi:hypothetical protein